MNEIKKKSIYIYTHCIHGKPSPYLCSQPFLSDLFRKAETKSSSGTWLDATKCGGTGVGRTEDRGPLGSAFCSGVLAWPLG